MNKYVTNVPKTTEGSFFFNIKKIKFTIIYVL